MPQIVREPIGLRVLIRAHRPDDHEPFLLWRADPQPEIDALLFAGEDAVRAALWAALLRWSEAQTVAAGLIAQGWQVTMRGIRVIVLDRAVDLLAPPGSGDGWLLTVGSIELRAIAARPADHSADLQRLLAFLDRPD